MRLWELAPLSLISVCLAQCQPVVQITPGGERVYREGYRLLRTDKSLATEQPRVISYRISVDRRLQKEDFEKIICEVIANEKPDNYDMLSIAFYYRLDQYIPPLEHPGLTRKYQEHSLGHYTWNRKQPGNRYALAIFKDTTGTAFRGGPQFFPFDHYRDCK